jgi:hypothetical protein
MLRVLCRTFNAQQTYVNAVVDDKETLNVLHNVLTRDMDKDVYVRFKKEPLETHSPQSLTRFLFFLSLPIERAQP